MGIINGLGYENNGETKIGLRGPRGLDAVLPDGILLDSGVVMKADIDMNLHQIKRVAYPSSSALDCAVPKSYVDNFLKLDGSKGMLDYLNMNDHRVEYIGTAISNTDAINMRQTNDLIATQTSKLLKRAGDVMFGDLNMRNNTIIGLPLPTTNNQPATKEYSDNKQVLYLNGTKKMVGPINMNNNTITNLKLAIKPSDAISLSYLKTFTISENNTEFLSYNGNNYILIKLPLNKESVYFIFRQSINLTQTNTTTTIFDFFTDSELIIRRGGYYDFKLFLNY